MAKYCIKCNRSFSKGSFKYNTCKECRHMKSQYDVTIVETQYSAPQQTVITQTTTIDQPQYYTSPPVVPPPMYTTPYQIQTQPNIYTTSPYIHINGFYP